MANKNQVVETINMALITPEKTVFQGPVTMVVIPGEEGDFGVLPRHECFATTLREGEVRVYALDKIIETIPITGGFAEVNQSGCQILADGLAA